MDLHPTTWRFTVAVVPFVVTSTDTENLSEVRRLLNRHLAIDDSAPEAPGALHLQVARSGPQRPTDLEPVHVADHISVWRTPSGFWLEAGNCSAIVHPNAGRVDLTLGPGFLELPGNSKRDLVLTPMVMLMRQRGSYVLHASGADRDGRGALVVGRSGSGKTTTALSLIANGWRFLGDDMVALDTDHDRCVARAFRRSASTDHAKLARFGFTDPPYPDDAGGTPPFDIDLDPGRAIDAFQPSVLLFPAITSSDTTRISPLNPAETLADLGSAMGGIMTDPQWAKRQLDAAAVLTQQAVGYRVLLGRDVYEHPSLLPDMLTRESVL